MPDPMTPAPIRPEIAALETSGIAQLFALGPGRDDLIALWVGEGDLPTPGFLQEGCLAALREGEPFVREMVARFRRGRDLVHQGLSALPRVRLASPPGAFYAFFAVEGLEDSLAAAKEILTRTGVGLAPGSAFGPGGEGHLRLCFASGTERLSEALERLGTVLG